MSHTVSDVIACPKIQEDLNNQFLTNKVPNRNAEPQGFTDFVLSPFNTDGIVQIQTSPGGGKKRTVELVYTPPILEVEVGTTPAKKCTSTNEAGQLSQDYEVGDSGVTYDEKFSLTTMASMCKSNELWFAERIQAMIDVLVKKIGTINAEQLALLAGSFGSGETGVIGDVKTVSTKKADGTYDIDAIAEITFAAMNAGYGTTPFVFGFHELAKYMKKVAAGCCGNEGIDYGLFAAQNDLVFVPDKKITNTLGDTSFMMVAPGAVQMLSWLEFDGPDGINMINEEAYKQTIITDPKTGLRFDMQLTNTCGEISVVLKLVHKLVGLPLDMYSVGDPFRGVTFVNEFAITNP